MTETIMRSKVEQEIGSRVSATEAKNRFGQVLERAQAAPVVIEKSGRPHSVVMSNERYEELLSAAAGESMASRRRQFEERYRHWIAEENARFEKHGNWNEAFRPW